MKLPVASIISRRLRKRFRPDNPAFEEAEYSVQYERVETAKDMKVELDKQPWDLVISDYKLPRFNAAAALALLQKTNLDIPFIIVSGSIGEEIADIS